MTDQEWLNVATKAIQAWNLNVVDISLVSFSENVAFKVTADDDQSYVLRIHRPTYHTLEELESEQIWTEALLDSGMDVPEVLRTKNNQRYSQIQVEDHHRYVGLLRWVEGKSMRQLMVENEEQDTIEQVEQRVAHAYSAIGSLLAQLHSQASNWIPSPNFSRHSLDSDGLMGEQPFWGRFWEAGSLNQREQEELLQLRNEIYRLLVQLPKGNDTYSLIHADLHTNNIILNQSSLHIIDFDDAGFGWHAYDFAVALAEYEDSRLRSIAEEALFSSYREGRSLPPYVRELVAFFELIRIVASIGWLDARPDRNLDPKGIPRLYSMAIDRASDVLRDAKQTISNIQTHISS